MACKTTFSLFSLLLLLLCGCRQSLYYFASSTASKGPVHSFPGTSESNPTAVDSIYKISDQTVGFSAQKIKNRKPGLLTAKPANFRPKEPGAAKLLAHKISRQAATKAAVQKSRSQPRKQLTGSVSKAFPLVWFIILSATLVTLFILFLAGLNKPMPSFGELYLFLMFPISIPWLLIIAKALAPGYGFLVFLAMVLTIILMIVFIDWLIRLREKAREAQRGKALREMKEYDPNRYYQIYKLPDV